MIVDPKFIPPAYLQYIDMGTAALLIQLAIAGIAGGVYWLKTYWNQIKEYFKKKFKHD